MQEEKSSWKRTVPLGTAAAAVVRSDGPRSHAVPPLPAPAGAIRASATTADAATVVEGWNGCIARSRSTLGRTGRSGENAGQWRPADSGSARVGVKRPRCGSVFLCDGHFMRGRLVARCSAPLRPLVRQEPHFQRRAMASAARASGKPVPDGFQGVTEGAGAACAAAPPPAAAPRCIRPNLFLFVALTQGKRRYCSPRARRCSTTRRRSTTATLQSWRSTCSAN